MGEQISEKTNMFKNLKFRTQLWLGNGTVLLLMVIIAGVVYRSINSLISTSEWVMFTHEIIEKGGTLQKSLVDMETGERGFLITGKEDFLVPYYEGKKRFEEVIVQTKEKISHNPQLVELLDKVSKLANQWHDQVAQVAIEQKQQLETDAKDADYLQELLNSGVGKNLMDEMRTLLDQLRSNMQAKSDQSAEILSLSLAKDMVDQETGFRGFLVTGTESFLEPYNAGIKALETHLTEIKRHLADDTTNLQRVNQVEALAAEWREKAVEPALAVRQEMNQHTTRFKDIVAPIIKGAGKKLMDEMQQLLTQFIEAEKELLKQRQAESANTANITLYTTLYGALLAIIIGLLLIILLTRSIMRVVNKIVDSSSAVSTAAEEISQGNLNLSQRTEQQAASLQQTAASMEEMTGTVQQNTDNAKQASQLAINARDRAQQGGEVVGTAIAAMGEINNSSKKVSDIIGVIDEIAFQTNLLALNAAVEAARAGEQGRGFAVVATEVRSLAQRSAAAAKEIKSLIQDSLNKVKEGTQLVDQSGSTLEEIVIAVKKASDVIIEIAAASEEQTGGIQQVNKAIMQLDEITQQNAALVEEAAAASESMKEQAQQLKEHIGFFKTKSEKEDLAAIKPESSPELSATKLKQKSRKKPDSHPHSIANSHQLASATRSKLKSNNDDDDDDPRDDNGWVDF